MPLLRTVIFCVFTALLGSLAFSGGWQTKNTTALPVALAGGNQSNQQVVSDGDGGFFVVWQDRRGGSLDRIYAQHVDAVGDTLWPANGIRLSYSKGYQYYPQAVADGLGGFIVAWEDDRNGRDYDIYAQRIDSYGTHVWGNSAAAVCTVSGNQYNPKVTGDGNGGAVIVWQDRRGADYDIYAQHLNPAGSATWSVNGVQVCAIVGDQIDPSLTSDGAGGAIVSWTDYRSTSTGPDIFAQAIRATGAAAWTSAGIPVCAASQAQTHSQVVADLSGGAICTWQDIRNSSSYQIYAQHLSTSGSALWEGNGLTVASAHGNQVSQSTVSDLTGGAVVAWADNRSGNDYDIYAQRLDGTNGPAWAASGVAVCVASGTQQNPQIDFDHGSILVSWEDLRVPALHSVYCQNLDIAAGGVRWQANGVLAYQSNGDQIYPQIVNDGAQGCIVAWADYGSGDGSTNLYAQRIGANGLIGGGGYRTFTQSDFGTKAVTFWTRVKGDYAMPNPGNVRDSLFKRGDFPSGVTIGVSRTDSLKNYAWLVYTKSIYVLAALPQTGASRRFDSLNGKIFTGKLTNPTLTKMNEALVGEALTLKVNIGVGDFGLTDLQAGDLIYRDTKNPVDPLNGKSLRQISVFVDSALTMWRPFNGLKYALLDSSLHQINGACAGAMDTVSTSPLKVAPARALFSVPFLVPAPAPPASGNSSMSEPLAGERQASSVMLLQNYPNPFNPSTRISFNLNSPSVVSLRVYNVLGQEVRRLIDHASLAKGLHEAVFDGSNLASGLYFYHLETENGGGAPVSVIRKMMLVK